MCTAAALALTAAPSVGAAACGDDVKGNISIAADPAFEPAIAELVRFVPYHGCRSARAPTAFTSTSSPTRRSRRRATGSQRPAPMRSRSTRATCSARSTAPRPHARGGRVGLNIQLFGQSNLQLAFDLSEDRTGTIPIADEIAARLPLVTDGVPFDVYDLSFGEFFSADPQRFIDAGHEVRHQLRGLAPLAEMHAVVHVGAAQVVRRRRRSPR